MIDVGAGNFNTGLFRFNALVAVCLLQAWLMWNFIMFQVKRMREAASGSAVSSTGVSSAGGKSKKTQQERAKARKEKKEGDPKSEDDELPEVDQDTNLRKRVK